MKPSSKKRAIVLRIPQDLLDRVEAETVNRRAFLQQPDLPRNAVITWFIERGLDPAGRRDLRGRSFHRHPDIDFSSAFGAMDTRKLERSCR
jgi:hypothetical protein